MSKRSFTEGSWRTDPWFAELCAALAACKTAGEVGDFLRDVGTLTELQAWSERLEVARQIAEGKTYRDITKATGASTTTVTRVARFLQGGEGGYKKALSARRHHRHASSSHDERMARSGRRRAR